MSQTQLVVVSDTNIFIDLIDLDLYKDFLQLGYQVHTNIFVLYELRDKQQRAYLDDIGGLIVEQFDTPGFMAQVYQFFDERQRKGLSFTDCTVLYQGITLSATVLTGDKKMMRSAKEMDIDVRGILYIFDQLVEQGILSHSTACQKLQQLFSRNTRLPKDEIDKRLTLWSNS